MRHLRDYPPSAISRRTAFYGLTAALIARGFTNALARPLTLAGAFLHAPLTRELGFQWRGNLESPIMIQLSLVAVSIVLIGLQCRRLTDKGLRPEQVRTLLARLRSKPARQQD